MQESAKKWPKRLVFIKGLIAGCISLLLITGFYYGTYAKVAHGRCMVRHRVIMGALEKHLDSGERIPRNLSELADLEYISDIQKFSISPSVSFEKKRHDLKYYPDAWNKPGRIILQSCVCGSHVVTLGDGSVAVLSYWHYKPEKKQRDETNLSNEEYHLQAPGVYATLPPVVLFILLVVSLFIIVCVERIMKKRQEKPEQVAN